MMKNNLKEIRMREYMLGSSEFAKMLGIHRSTYSQWENSTNNPPLYKALEIAKKLNKTVEEIWFL